MECSRCELCSAATEAFSRGSTVHLALLFRVVTGPIAVALNVLLATAVFRTKCIPFNTRILLFILSISMVVTNTGLFLGALVNLIVSYVLPDDTRCEYEVFSPHLHEAYQIVVETGQILIFLTLISLCLECTVAACSKKNTEKKPTKWRVISMCVFQGLKTLAMIVFLHHGTLLTLPYQAAELSNPDRYKRVKTTALIVSGVILVIFAVIAWFSRNKKRSAPSSAADDTSLPLLLSLVSLVFFFTNLFVDTISHFWLPRFPADAPLTSEMLAQVVAYSPYGEIKKALLSLSPVAMCLLILVSSKPIQRTFLELLKIRRQGGEGEEDGGRGYLPDVGWRSKGRTEP